MRKPVFGVSDQVRNRAVQPKKVARGLKYRIYKVQRLFYVAKTKALISCAVMVQLICAFAFAYAKIRCSHYAARFALILNTLTRNENATHRI